MLYVRDGVIWPKTHDPLLASLFSWTEKLGVFGGSLVYNKIKHESMKAMPALMSIPAPFNLSLEGDLYVLSEQTNAWSVKFPYYFMILQMQVFLNTNGMKTEWVVLSTGAAKHNGGAGMSQATLVLIHSPSDDFDSFSNYWLGRFGISPETKLVPLGVGDLESRSVFRYIQIAPQGGHALVIWTWLLCCCLLRYGWNIPSQSSALLGFHDST